jgi:hypothetical protein
MNPTSRIVRGVPTGRVPHTELKRLDGSRNRGRVVDVTDRSRDCHECRQARGGHTSFARDQLESSASGTDDNRLNHVVLPDARSELPQAVIVEMLTRLCRRWVDQLKFDVTDGNWGVVGGWTDA